jgi:predicted phage baseplate assembly protein
MLGAIGTHPALDGWRADAAHDLGVMLIEAWAYVLDTLGFYDALIANRSYLGTAADDAIAAEIVALTGYRPRPAMVARVRLALEARGRDPVAVPAATGFRSQPFGAEKAQVFELAEPVTVWPQRNRWPLGPHRLSTFDGTLRFAPAEGPTAGAVVSVSTTGLRHAARVIASTVEPAADGERYRTVTLDPPLPGGFAGVELAALTVEVLALAASPTPLTAATTAVTSTQIILDALYPMLQPGMSAAIEVDGALTAVALATATKHDLPLAVGSAGATATMPLSKVTFASIGTIRANAAIRVHLVPKPAGTPLRPAETRITLGMIAADGRLADRGTALDEAPASGEAMAQGQRAAGLFAPGTLTLTPVPRFQPDMATEPVALETPVAILGNVITAIRGETVANEVLGSGDAQVPGQRLALKKKPLSWIEDAASPLGRVPQITLRVDGIAWQHVDGFFGRGPEDAVYRIEMGPDGTATVIGGDGQRGRRFPSGVRNIVASYRHGAGAAKPPPGSITQFARAAAGLSRVSQPLDAWGGADAETSAEMQNLAPTGALTLGRAVSLADFEAMIRGSSGILNAAVAYVWDQARQTAVVTGWIVADAGDPSATLAAWLSARALPGLAIRILLATRIEVPVFDVSLATAPGHAPETVRAAVRAALFDPATGVLAPRNVPVGAPLFRSQLVAAIHAVPGVAAVPSVTLGSGPMPKALVPGEGAWFDFLAHGQVL